jgi:serine/threonine-protein kinase
MNSPADLLLTKGGDWETPPGRSSRSKTGLPLTVLQQSSKRLQVVCVTLFGLVAFGWFAGNLIEGQLVGEFETPLQWAPPIVMLSASLIVFGLARSQWLTASAVITVGLAYEVVIAFCIPISEYYNAFRGVDPLYISGDLVGLSPVALWMIFFTVLVPSKPRNALIALTLSGSAVPITIGLLAGYGNAPALPAMNFATIFVLPYVACIVMSYIAARIIYRLGADISRAQAMGSYYLQELIGRGGMGEVWRAEHKMLARPAAIKLIRSDFIGSEPGAVQRALTRFEREAQVTASLQSPHTVELYDYGISDDGTFYYVMELLDGVDLESLVNRSGPLAAERVVYILRQACHSLGEAHRKNLIHRDIKPANVFLCQRAFEYDFVKVLDFGLVKPGSTVEARPAKPVTEAGTVAGTPDYMAPELAVGEETIDGRSDIYSLGCVAYWLLTGRRVFEKETSVAKIAAHINTPAEAPSAGTELPVPAELDSLVLACLSKDPADRPEAAEDLDLALAEIGTETPWTQERAAEWWRLHVPTSDSHQVLPDT